MQSYQWNICHDNYHHPPTQQMLLLSYKHHHRLSSKVSRSKRSRIEAMEAEVVVVVTGDCHYHDNNTYSQYSSIGSNLSLQICSNPSDMLRKVSVFLERSLSAFSQRSIQLMRWIKCRKQVVTIKYHDISRVFYHIVLLDEGGEAHTLRLLKRIQFSGAR